MSSGRSALRGALAAAIGILFAGHAPGAEPRACAGEPALPQLDFWLGEWVVCAQGEPVGRNRVSKILDGCAVTEEWLARDGTRGSSLFYYSASEALWKQVWVTDVALHPGGLKEKHLVTRFSDGGVSFQGEISLPDGRRILDRTSLRPGAKGSVSQRIEISRDGGDSWTTTFDAEYRPAPAVAASSPGAAVCR